MVPLLPLLLPRPPPVYICLLSCSTTNPGEQHAPESEGEDDDSPGLSLSLSALHPIENKNNHIYYIIIKQCFLW